MSKIDPGEYPLTVASLDGSEQRATVFLDRYAMRGADGTPEETFPDQMWKRVADAIGADDDQAHRFNQLMRDFKFVPGGRILSGAGTGTDVTMFNCYVIPVESKARRSNRAVMEQVPHLTEDEVPSEWLATDKGNDSREAIIDTIGLMVDIMSRGGGVGVNWSTLRPAGAHLKTINATSSGPIDWMHLASTAVGTVEQGGSRRGAAMFLLHDWHPDVLKFIDAKRESGRITNANISVAVSDAFMEAVARDEEWELSFPDTSDPDYDALWDGDLMAWHYGLNKPLKVYEVVKARDMWRKLTDAAWASGEPGVVFLDRCNNLSTAKGIEKVTCVNPCLSGDTLIATVDGPKTIESLVGSTPLVYSFDADAKKSVVRRAVRVWQTSESAETIRLTLDSGTVLTVTPNHNLYVFKGRFGVKKMEAKDIKVGASLKAYGISEQPNESGRLRMHNWPGSHSWVSREIWEAVHGESVPDGMVVHHIDHDPSNNAPSNLALISSYDHQSHHYAQRVANGFGSHGWKSRPAGANHKVVSIEAGPTIPVYNMTVEGTHTYVIADATAQGKMTLSGIVSSNCGEQPLGAYSVCNLGSMNLAAYILNENGYSPSSKSFDWDRFNTDVQVAVEFLDRCIDVNKYFIPENERAQKDLRRIGLGVMGLADALILLGISYGSPDAVRFTEEVFSAMKHSAVYASTRLAERLGPALAWDSAMLTRPYLNDLPGIYLEDIKEYGLRNLFLLTQAPTGTTSILAGVNSGIEPLFDISYVRTDRTGVHRVFAPVIERVFGKDASPLDLPDYVTTASEVTVEEHIAMQAAVQRHIDSSVSKTINAPSDQTKEETAKAYQLAYDSGLKGLAYYRDRSRDVQVLSRDEKPALGTSTQHIEWCESAGGYGDLDCTCPETPREDILLAKYNALSLFAKSNEMDMPFTRPEVLHGTTRKVPSRHGSVYVTVNRDDMGKPVEVFFAAGKSGEEVMQMAEAMGRLASLALRKGATLGGVANQLEGIGGQTKIAFQKSLPHAIGMALSEENQRTMVPVDRDFDEETLDLIAQLASGPLSFPDEPVFTSDFTDTVYGDCPGCSDGTVVYEEGCRKCHSCGWSAC